LISSRTNDEPRSNQRIGKSWTTTQQILLKIVLYGIMSAAFLMQKVTWVRGTSGEELEMQSSNGRTNCTRQASAAAFHSSEMYLA
jgi:hypothetical protein